MIAALLPGAAVSDTCRSTSGLLQAWYAAAQDQ
jgi:hypothetical protein